MQSYSNAIEKGKSTDELTDIQKKGQQILPSWQELIDVIDEEVYRYNHFHQHSQIKSTPIKKRTELIEKLRSMGEDVSPLSEIEARDMFRPRFIRRVQRGRVDYAAKSYGDERLEYFDGQDVFVDIDIHDPSTVVVRQMSGQYICDARALTGKLVMPSLKATLKRLVPNVKQVLNAVLKIRLTVLRRKIAHLLNMIAVNSLLNLQQLKPITKKLNQMMILSFLSINLRVEKLFNRLLNLN